MKWLTIYVNNICNLDCKYCFVDKSNRTKLLIWSKQFENIIIDFFLQDWFDKKISIMWWEPLLNKIFIYKLVNFINSAKINFPDKNISFTSIPTNWIIFDKEFYSFLKNNNIKLRFSIDNLLNTYDINRLDLNWKKIYYKKIFKNIEYYKNIFLESPEIRIVISKFNVNILEDLITELSKKWFLDIMIGPSYWFNLDKLFENDFLKSFIKIVDLYILNINNLNYINIDPIETILVNILKWGNKNFKIFNNNNEICWMWNEISISFDWNIYSCDFIAWSDYVNNLLKEKYLLWNIKKWVNWEKTYQDYNITNININWVLWNKLGLNKKICFLFDSSTRALTNNNNAKILFSINEYIYKIIFLKFKNLNKDSIIYLKNKYWIY